MYLYLGKFPSEKSVLAIPVFPERRCSKCVIEDRDTRRREVHVISVLSSSRLILFIGRCERVTRKENAAAVGSIGLKGRGKVPEIPKKGGKTGRPSDPNPKRRRLGLF
jgi:hypothetical protein